MKKVFIIKMKNEKNGEITNLSSFAFKDYQFAVESLKEHLINERYNLQCKEFDENTDMTEILKGFIEVYETKKGKATEVFGLDPIKTYNYNF